jgi:hypothetical protein
MILMNETEFVAHALTDYLSAFIEPSFITAIHQTLTSGEAGGAIGFALGVAASEAIPLPALMREKILTIPDLSDKDREWFVESLRIIPVVELAA